MVEPRHQRVVQGGRYRQRRQRAVERVMPVLLAQQSACDNGLGQLLEEQGHAVGAGEDLLEDLGFTRAEILFRLRYQRPDSSFRSHYAYTNFGITEGAVAAVKPYRLEWEEACAQKLYKPLGMTSTSSRYADFTARQNKALGHVKVDGNWVQKFKRDPDAQSPTGGVSSSVNDVAKWIRLQLANGKFDGKQIVSE